MIVVFSLVCSLVLTYVVMKWARKKAIMDIPNERSSHSIPTPRGGGLAIIITFYLVLIFLFYSKAISPKLFYALLPGIALGIVGFIDDMYSLSYKIRLIVQILIVALSVLLLGDMNNLIIQSDSIIIRVIVVVVITIAMVWWINLFNFLDGIDGYAGMEAIVILVALFFISHDLITIYLSVMILGFLNLNWQPAKIFMGDVGSTVLGYLIGVLFIYYLKASYGINIFYVLIISALFWFDATYTIIRRYLNKENLSIAHKKHAYQRLVQFGYSHQKVVLLGFAINVILLGFALVAYFYPQYQFYLLLLSLFLLSTIMFRIEKLKPFGNC